MFESSIRFKNKWIDSFFIYSLIWAFGSVLTEPAKREFSNWLKKTLKEASEERLIHERKLRFKKDEFSGSDDDMAISEELSESSSSNTSSSESKGSVI